LEIFQGVEAILHAGDVSGEHILQQLEQVAPVYAVAGNCDETDPMLPDDRVVQLPFGAVGIAHGHVFSPNKETRLKQLLDHFYEHEVNIILTGHSHLQYLEFRKGVFIVNPGAACRPRFSVKPSVCILSWNEEEDSFGFSFCPFVW
jgi:putative phosphoesterase